MGLQPQNPGNQRHVPQPVPIYVGGFTGSPSRMGGEGRALNPAGALEEAKGEAEGAQPLCGGAAPARVHGPFPWSLPMV